MRYKTLTVSSNSKTTSCFTSNGEEWPCLDDALNNLYKYGWEIDHVINKTILVNQNQEQLLLNQPLLILKNTNISGLNDIIQQIQRQNDKISNLRSIIEKMEESSEKYKAEDNLHKQQNVLEKLNRAYKDYEKIQEKIDKDAYRGHELEDLINL